MWPELSCQGRFGGTHAKCRSELAPSPPAGDVPFEHPCPEKIDMVKKERQSIINFLAAKEESGGLPALAKVTKLNPQSAGMPTTGTFSHLITHGERQA